MWNADGTRELLILSGSGRPYADAAWSPDGRRIVASSDDGNVWVWRDLKPLTGVDDPRLWTATTYCSPVERRMGLLDVSGEEAEAQHDACV